MSQYYSVIISAEDKICGAVVLRSSWTRFILINLFAYDPKISTLIKQFRDKLVSEQSTVACDPCNKFVFSLRIVLRFWVDFRSGVNGYGSVHMARKNANLKTNSTYERLLQKAKLPTLLNRRLQDICILMYKLKHNLSPLNIRNCYIFQEHNSPYNLRQSGFSISRYNTVTYGKHSLRYLGPTLCSKLTTADQS